MRQLPLALAAVLILSSAAQAQVVAPAQLLPVVAKVSGAQGTDWMTSASISNLSDTTETVTAMFFREATANNPLFGVPTKELTLGPGATITTSDVLGQWFPSQGNSKGALLLFTGSLDDLEAGGDIAVTARIFNNANPAATYGQSVSSNPVSVVVGNGVSVMTGIRHDGQTRSNIGIVNLSLRETPFLISTYDASGALIAQRTRSVEMMSIRQWNLSDLGASNISQPGRVEVQIDPAAITWDPCDLDAVDLGSMVGIFMAYVSKVDGATGDAEFAYGLTDWSDQVAQCGTSPDDCP